MAKKATTARKINPKAKKYKQLLALQKEVNKMVKESGQRLGKEHKAYKQVQAKKRQFYKSRGMKSPAQFSAKNIKTSDVEAYKALLESIKESTYINKENYDKYIKDKVQMLKDKGLAETEAEALKVFDIMEDYKDELREMGIPLSDFVQMVNELENEYNMTEEEFEKIFETVSAYYAENKTADIASFFDLTEKIVKAREIIKELNDAGVGLNTIYGLLESNITAETLSEWGKEWLQLEDREEVDFEEFINDKLSGK